jgi:hypothetical protein
MLIWCAFERKMCLLVVTPVLLMVVTHHMSAVEIASIVGTLFVGRI